MNASIEEIRDPLSGELLHQVIRIDDSPGAGLERVDFSNASEFLQGAVISIPSMHEFRPHIHLERSREFTNLRAQESWVVIRGSVEVHFYSENGEKLTSRTLGPGDASITFRGGHGYGTYDSGALVYEYKSGPYEGQEVDKLFI